MAVHTSTMAIQPTLRIPLNHRGLFVHLSSSCTFGKRV